MTQQHQIPQPTLPDPSGRPPNRWWLWALLGVALAGVVAVVAGGVLTSRPAASTTHTVLYEATADTAYGSGRTGMVTAQAPDGGRQQTGLLPITGTFTTHTGDFVYLSVQNQQPAGSVTCRITVDGKVVSENTSDGGYTIATCQGKVPR